MTLAGLFGSCILTLCLLAAILFLRSGSVYAFFYRHELVEKLDRAGAIFQDITDKYDEAITQLSESRVIGSAFSDPDKVSESILRREINNTLKKYGISPQVHIIGLGKTPLISTGFGEERFDRRHYAIDILVDQTEGTLFHANHFFNSNKIEMVQTAARKIMLEGKCVGYVYFDMPVSEIDEAFRSDEELRLFGEEYQSYYTVCSWFNYVVYSQSKMADSLIYAGGRYIDASFLDRFESAEAVSSIQSVAGTEYYVVGKQIGTYVVLCSVPVSLFRRNNSIAVIIVLIMALTIALYCIAFSLKIYRTIANPISNILTVMNNFADGDRNAKCEFTSVNEMGVIRDQLNDMISSINQMMDNNEEKQKQLFLAEDNILKAQIKPHFIKNTLESIRWTIQMGNKEEAVSAIKKLSRLFSERIYSSEHETIRECLDSVKNYVDIQRLCYGDILSVDYDVDETALDVMVPSFILQPLVENAIIHGLQSREGPGVLGISVKGESGGVRIAVSDDGIGFSEDPAGLLDPERQKKGLGLYNVHRRLQLEYGAGNGLTIASIPDIGTTVSMFIPDGEAKDS